MADITGAYIAQSDVSDLTGIAISATSNPTSTEFDNLAKKRATELNGFMQTHGIDVTPENGSAAIDVTTNQGQALRDAFRHANAAGTAIDQVAHHFKGVSPAKTKKLDHWKSEWDRLKEAALDLAQKVYGKRTLQTPYSEGEIEEPTLRTDTGADGQRVGVSILGDDL